MPGDEFCVLESRLITTLCRVVVKMLCCYCVVETKMCLKDIVLSILIIVVVWASIESWLGMREGEC
jgi:hypothetical protein